MLLKSDFLDLFLFNTSSGFSEPARKTLLDTLFLNHKRTNQFDQLKSRAKSTISNLFTAYYRHICSTKYVMWNIYPFGKRYTYRIKPKQRLELPEEVKNRIYEDMLYYYNNEIIPFLNEHQADEEFENIPIVPYPIRFEKLQNKIT